MENKRIYLTATDIKYQLANLNQLTFEVTDACNMRCKYCGYGELYEGYDKREKKMMNINAVLKLIDYLAELWNSDLNNSAFRNVFISFYGGEPLINMEFIKTIVTYFENLDCRHRSFSYSMTTNATLLDRYMDFLVSYKFNLLISLDGNEYNNSYRVNKAGKPVFHQIIKNIDALRLKYSDYFEEKVNFNAVLHNRNSVENIYQFIRERYNKISRIGDLNTVGIRPDKIDLFRKMYRNSRDSLRQSENCETIEHNMFHKSASYQRLIKFLHNYGGFTYHDYMDLLFEKQIIETIPTGTCLPFSRRMFVTVNGKILPCERIRQQFALGSISETGVDLNWVYFKLSQIRRLRPCERSEAIQLCSVSLLDCFGLRPRKDEQGFLHWLRQFEMHPYQQVETLLYKNTINSTIYPVYTKHNLPFFEKQVYMDTEDIFSNTYSFRQIFAHQKLNTNFFGALTIFPNGDVYANVNSSILGNLNQNSLLDLIDKELRINTAWRVIRNQKPCSDCLYQFLCPSPSNYETVIGKPNLCHINL